jgi:sugar lactone lactonase YvrE
MKQRHKSKRFVRTAASLAMVLVMALLCIPGNVFAAEIRVPYTTYTFSYEGWAMESPDAYVPVARYQSADLLADITGARGMAVGPDGKLYLANTVQNSILIYDTDMKLLRTLAGFIDESKIDPDLIGLDGDPSVQTLSAPEGVFVDRRNHLFVADTANRRIVEFDPEFRMVRQIDSPESEVLRPDFLFAVSGVAVDTAGRIFALVKNETSGIVQMDRDGNFTGYFGAQKVRRRPFDMIREWFLNDDQRERSIRFVPRQYNSIAIDRDNFIWLTTNAIESGAILEATYSRSRETDNMPVKRFNMNGDDVLIRGGVFPPTGDVACPCGFCRASSIVHVALKDNGLYSILDQERNKIFTYDEYGNLLYAFGGSGVQMGLFTQVSQMAYRGSDIIVLDTDGGAITVFEMTAYGELLERALMAERNREFDVAYDNWREVMRQNNNFDLAYTGIARVMLRQGEYQKAMEYYRYAGNRLGYTRAYEEHRKGLVHRYIWVFPVGAVVLVFAFMKWGKYTERVNRTSKLDFKKYTLWHEVVFGFRLLFHPFDGFWDLKHERRGSMRAAHTIVAFVTLTFVYRALATGYIFREIDVMYINLFQEMMNVILPLLLWCTACWALTTLMNGQAKMRDIYMVTSYALLPLGLMNIPVTLMSNFLVLNEAPFMGFLDQVGAVWFILLVFFGVMTLQQYTFMKNAMTTVMSLVFMAAELFALMLFLLLGNNIWRFVSSIYREIVYRM